MHRCEKCGKEVPRANDATILYALVQMNGGSGDPEKDMSSVRKHLLPVFEGGTQVCEGSPSVAQYLEGQPRDTRDGMAGFYDPATWEARYRAAYATLQQAA